MPESILVSTDVPADVASYAYWNTFMDAMRKKPYQQTDFEGGSWYPWINVGYGTTIGTLAGVAPTDRHHPGIARLSSSIAANSGYLFRTGGSNSILIGGGELYECVFSIPNLAPSGTTTTIRLGYGDSTNNADHVDGVYLEAVVTNTTITIVGKTASNSSRSTTTGSYTGATGTWYRVRIVINSDATLVTFKLYDMSGTELSWSGGTNTLSTNIPTGSGRQCGHGANASNSGTSATDMVDLDYMAVGYNVALTR